MNANSPQKLKSIKVIASNRKAYHEYFFIDRYKAGVALVGTEVKSARGGRINMSDAFCLFKDGELWLRNMHIAEYPQGGLTNHLPKHDRKLLLQKRELRRLEAKIKERGLTIVPVEVFINERDMIKVEIALAKGKKAYDKRDSIKDRDLNRDMNRERERDR
jgi:SsrA-binding protein